MADAAQRKSCDIQAAGSLNKNKGESMITLKASNTTEQRILDYLNQNASDALTEKINSGTKTLAGAMKYAKKEAQKLGAADGCVCVDDETVFGWIVHFFEEEDVEEPKAAKPAVRVPGGAAVKPVETPKPKAQQKATVSMLDALFGGK